MTRLLPLSLLLACTGPEYGLGPVETTPSPEAIWTRSPLPSSGSAIEVSVDLATGAHKEVFEVGERATTSRTDFLFVIDDSVSMKRLRTRSGQASAPSGRRGPSPRGRASP